MGIGISVFLIAVGAIMSFALDSNGEGGVSFDTVGIILIIVGVIGLLTSLLIFGSWRERGGTTVVREERL